MSTNTEKLRAGFFMISEANGFRSRDTGTLKSGQNLQAGAVVGQVLHDAAATVVLKVGNTGTGSIGTVTVGAGAKAGRHTLTIIEPGSNAGVFSLHDPDGVELPTGTVAVAYAAGGLSFTLADATDFVAGDQIYIDVDGGTSKYVEHDPAATDGSETASGILFDACDASSADKTCVVIKRDAEVNTADLVWKSGMTSDEKTAGRADLLALGIVCRS